MTLRTPPPRGTDRTPSWVVFALSVALVFGLYYIGIGVRDYFTSGGLGVAEATQRAEIVNTATAVQAQIRQSRATPVPSFTPIPECTPFVVIVERAIVREAPSINAPIVTQWSLGSEVCVLGRVSPGSEWYQIDENPSTRRIDAAYMREDLIEAVNPTPTPSLTYTPPPTITSTPSPTATPTPEPLPTATPNPNASATPTATPTPTATQPFESA
ncbi:MAG: SH3 domain-containing protein [Chloroflexi bacterium]|nr:SH3 domain-containing protein [Chloroflexota bacterium]